MNYSDIDIRLLTTEELDSMIDSAKEGDGDALYGVFKWAMYKSKVEPEEVEGWKKLATNALLRSADAGYGPALDRIDEMKARHSNTETESELKKPDKKHPSKQEAPKSSRYESSAKPEREKKPRPEPAAADDENEDEDESKTGEKLRKIAFPLFILVVLLVIIGNVVISKLKNSDSKADIPAPSATASVIEETPAIPEETPVQETEAPVETVTPIETPAPSSAPAGSVPGPHDLEGHSNVVAPDAAEYLKAYETMYVHSNGGVAVYMYYDLNKEYSLLVSEKTQLTVIARSGQYDLVRTPAGDVGYVNSKWLTYSYPTDMSSQTVFNDFINGNSAAIITKMTKGDSCRLADPSLYPSGDVYPFFYNMATSKLNGFIAAVKTAKGNPPFANASYYISGDVLLLKVGNLGTDSKTEGDGSYALFVFHNSNGLVTLTSCIDSWSRSNAVLYSDLIIHHHWSNGAADSGDDYYKITSAGILEKTNLKGSGTELTGWNSIG